MNTYLDEAFRKIKEYSKLEEEINDLLFQGYFEMFLEQVKTDEFEEKLKTFIEEAKKQKESSITLSLNICDFRYFDAVGDFPSLSLYAICNPSQRYEDLEYIQYDYNTKANNKIQIKYSDAIKDILENIINRMGLKFVRTKETQFEIIFTDGE